MFFFGIIVGTILTLVAVGAVMYVTYVFRREIRDFFIGFTNEDTPSTNRTHDGH